MSRGAVNFRPRTTLWVASTGALLLGPFAINNLVQARWLLGLGSMVIVAILVHLALKARAGIATPFSVILFPPVLVFLVISITTQGVIGVLWSYPALVCFYFIFEERWAWVANAVMVAVIVPVAVNELESAIAMRAFATLAVVSVFSIGAVRIIEGQQRQLEIQATTDPLTGLHNRSLFATSLDRVAESAGSGETAASLLVIDLDYFKRINDEHGHAAGDAVLIEVGQIINRTIRAADRPFRIGGEEFVIVMPGADATDARRCADRLRCAISEAEILPGHAVTASIGVAELGQGETSADWLKRADHVLYAAKESGRNRVRLAATTTFADAPAP